MDIPTDCLIYKNKLYNLDEINIFDEIFKDVDNKSKYSIVVNKMSGERIQINNLNRDMKYISLLNIVKKEFNIREYYLTYLMMGDILFKSTEYTETIYDLGIQSDSQLTVVINQNFISRDECKLCKRTNSKYNKTNIKYDITINSMHHSWGKRWSKCKYDCIICNSNILQDINVNCCIKCKCFWHQTC